MQLNEYQHEVIRTCTVTAIPEAPPGYISVHAAEKWLGLAGEAGEACDLIKKAWRDRTPIDTDALRKELGDVLWYVAALAQLYGMTLQEVADANVDKLRERYPNGFVPLPKRMHSSNDYEVDVARTPTPRLSGRDAPEKSAAPCPAVSGVSRLTEPHGFQGDDLPEFED